MTGSCSIMLLGGDHAVRRDRGALPMTAQGYRGEFSLSPSLEFVIQIAFRRMRGPMIRDTCLVPAPRAVRATTIVPKERLPWPELTRRLRQSAPSPVAYSEMVSPATAGSATDTAEPSACTTAATAEGLDGHIHSAAHVAVRRNHDRGVAHRYIARHFKLNAAGRRRKQRGAHSFDRVDS